MKKPPKKDSPFSKFYKKKPPKEAAWDEPSYYADEEDDKPVKKQKKDKPAFKKRDGKGTPKQRKKPKKKEKAPKSVPAPVEENMRLNKYIAHAGICSRRTASEHIKHGAVMVTEVVLKEMGYK
ncbi:MAG: S4 domain-containing protein, partial [Aureispira sp.]